MATRLKYDDEPQTDGENPYLAGRLAFEDSAAKARSYDAPFADYPQEWQALADSRSPYFETVPQAGPTPGPVAPYIKVYDKGEQRSELGDAAYNAAAEANSHGLPGVRQLTPQGQAAQERVRLRNIGAGAAGLFKTPEAQTTPEQAIEQLYQGYRSNGASEEDARAKAQITFAGTGAHGNIQVNPNAVPSGQRAAFDAAGIAKDPMSQTNPVVQQLVDRGLGASGGSPTTPTAGTAKSVMLPNNVRATLLPDGTVEATGPRGTRKISLDEFRRHYGNGLG